MNAIYEEMQPPRSTRLVGGSPLGCCASPVSVKDSVSQCACSADTGEPIASSHLGCFERTVDNLALDDRS